MATVVNKNPWTVSEAIILRYKDLLDALISKNKEIEIIRSFGGSLIVENITDNKQYTFSEDHIAVKHLGSVNKIRDEIFSKEFNDRADGYTDIANVRYWHFKSWDWEGIKEAFLNTVSSKPGKTLFIEV